jgi:hypothetical protein
MFFSSLFFRRLVVTQRSRNWDWFVCFSETFDFRVPDGSSGAGKLGVGCCVSLGKSILWCIVSYMPQSLQCSEGCEERVGR